tara:strand:- start:11291 stop:12901 length:1611 start_codon:yes stop_codon:yes gene_type:complete
METGYTPKSLDFEKEGRDKLIKGVHKIASAVKSTLGPMGRTVLIESPNHTGGITVTKDGVTVAKAVDLLDPVQNLAVRMMKEASERTASSAGDGTTTAMVLTEALIDAAQNHMSSDTNVTEVLRYLQKESTVIQSALQDKAVEVTEDLIKDVATISANNDPVVGKIISDTYGEVGKDGIVTVERSQNSETYFETTNGIKIDRGYSSPMFINDFKRDECVLEDVHILVSDAEINNILQIEGLLKPILQQGKKLLIIANGNANVINTLSANVQKGRLQMCMVQPPSFGYKQHELMQDIALATGAKYFSEKTGDDLSIIKFEDLGHASKIVVSRGQTILVKDESDEAVEAVEERVAQLWGAHDNAKKKADKEFILSRIASLTGGVGVIHVGGNTDLEQKELFDRVDDAVCAVRSALQDGILPGAGLALLNMSAQYETNKVEDENQALAFSILNEALRAPARQILENASLSLANIYSSDFADGYGYDVKRGSYGDLIELGVTDPCKVTKNALNNAISVATTILSTNAIITMARSYEDADS